MTRNKIKTKNNIVHTLTKAKAETDSCKLNLDDCSPTATCVPNGMSFTCICQNVRIGDLNIEPASTSTGHGDDGCHYIHPNVDGHRLSIVNKDGRDTLAYIGEEAGSHLNDYAVKCQSLGMRMLTDTSVYSQLATKPGGDQNMFVPMGITRPWGKETEWRNIYTYDKTSPDFDWSRNSPLHYGYATAKRYEPQTIEVNTYNFKSPSNARTACIAPEEGESTEIDFCGTGFHNCHEGASCTNGGEAGYTCECQPLQFGDVTIQPVDVARTGRSCSYTIPGHDDKTLFPIRVHDNAGSDTVYAFHGSSEKHTLEEAIRYCRDLGMHLPLPKNEKENLAMQKVSSSTGWRQDFFRLAVHDSDKDNTVLNIYTGKEPSFLNDLSGELRGHASVVVFNSGYWDSFVDKELLTVCQDGGIDVSEIDWCGSGLHNCHAEANCLPPDDEDSGDDYRCVCNNQFTGNGVGEDGCVFNLKSKFLINNYNVDVTVKDRYARTQIAVSVTNMNSNSDELYKFGVALDEIQLISGFTMRMGDDGAVSHGDIHKEKEAQEIFDHAVSNGSGGAQSEPQTEPQTDTETHAAEITHISPGQYADPTTFAAKARF